MNQIILATHGGMSAGVHNTVEMILGDMPNLYHVATLRDETESVTEAVERIISGFKPEDPVYILTDIMGGSVNNEMMRLSAKHPGITVICGMNMALVLGIASETEALSRDGLENLIRQSREQMADCTELMQQAMDTDEEEDL